MASIFSGLSRLRAGLSPTLESTDIDGFYRELERSLLLADTGTETATWITGNVRETVGSDPGLADLGRAVKSSVGELLGRLVRKQVLWEAKPHVVMLVGTNGGGKTTTVAKIARKASDEGKIVILAAADTYRAAATEQLGALADSLGDKVRMIQGEKDPGAVAYSAVTAGLSGKADLVLVDTAGRQPTSKALMAEVRKISKAISKAMPGAPHERILAIDANTGQNALRQVEAFDEELGLTGCVLTKLDGTARGGVILAIAHRRPVPVLYVGVGERTEDLLQFDSEGFLAALFDPSS